MNYNDSIDEDDQITAEESIAVILFERYGLNEDDAKEASIEILLQVLSVFRPDLVENDW